MNNKYRRLNEIIQDRLSRIVSLARKIPKSHPVPIVKWFGRELGYNGSLFDVSYDQDLRPREGRLDIDASNTSCNILMSYGLLDLFLNFKEHFSEKYLCEAIDNFIVHEIVHRAQGMGDGNHRGLSAVAPNVLAELDYEADSSAALILFTLAVIEGWEDKNFRRIAENGRDKWALYAEIIRTTLSQIHIFNLMGRCDRPIDPDSAAEKTCMFAGGKEFVFGTCNITELIHFTIFGPFRICSCCIAPLSAFGTKARHLTRAS